MKKKITTYFLEMLNRDSLKPKLLNSRNGKLIQVTIPCPSYNRFLYTSVGGDWFWIDRLPWTYAQWMQYLDRPGLETWVVYVAGAPAGYFELEKQDGSTVQIVYFGILPEFTGKGIGGWMLTSATERAWQLANKRVWVHTCTTDHPAALANYLARGFSIYRKEDSLVALPEKPPGPWPGARP